MLNYRCIPLLLLIGTFAWNWSRESIENESVEQFDNGQKFAAMEHYFNAKLQDDKDLKSSEDSLVKVYLIDLKKLEIQQQVTRLLMYLTTQ